MTNHTTPEGAAASLTAEEATEQAAQLEQLRAEQDGQPEQPAAPEGVPAGVERATWKGHGNPQSFTFYGYGSLPEAPGVNITKVNADRTGLTLKRGNGRAAKGGSFGVATKFWAGACVLPEAAPKATAGRARAQAATAEGATRSNLPVHAGPAAWLGANGEVLPMSATAYPELMAGEGVLLRCLGACGELKKAGAFPCTANKGDGKGRYLECGACQAKRLAENKARKAAGGTTPAIERPRATVQAPAE